MQSTELASLAGVTVRTLRHYHQVGILAEPPRAANGYRRYGVHDLIRVLRIRRLAALGVPLDEMPNLLDGGAGETDDQGSDADGAAALLDRLDVELEAQMRRIAEQRALVAQLRLASGAPDMPPELARFLVVMAGMAPSPDVARMDRDQTVLLAHLVGQTGMPQLVGFYERMSEPDMLPAVMSIATRFAALGPSTSLDELSRFADDVVATFAPALRALDGDGVGLDLSHGSHLFDEYSRSTLDETKQRALALIGLRLEASSTS